MYIQDGRITEYQNTTSFNLNGSLITYFTCCTIDIIGLILVFSIFKPTHRKPGLYKDFDDGHVYDLKAVEKTAFDTVAENMIK